jgi:hypothetical protein
MFAEDNWWLALGYERPQGYEAPWATGASKRPLEISGLESRLMIGLARAFGDCV